MGTSAFSDQSQENQSLFISMIDVSNVNRVGSEGNNSRSLIGCLFCCITQRAWLPSECDYHSVKPITSTTRSPSLSCLPFHLFQIGLYLFNLCLIHSDFISYNFSTHPTFPSLSISITKTSAAAAGCLLTQEPRGTQLSS